MSDSLARNCIFTASVAVCHFKESKLLCVRHPTLEAWMFPGGHVELGESPHQAAVREVAEEVGLTIELVDISVLPPWSDERNHRLVQPLAIIEEYPNDTRNRFIDFIFAGLSFEDSLRLREKVSKAQWVDRETLGKLPVTYPIRELGFHVLDAIQHIRSCAARRPAPRMA